MSNLVVIESPYAGDVAEVEYNEEYARRCMRDCIERGEIPIASHLLYTQPGILDDNIPQDRVLGINYGLVWGSFADTAAFYIDNGMSNGMLSALEHWLKEGKHIELRRLA